MTTELRTESVVGVTEELDGDDVDDGDDGGVTEELTTGVDG